GWTTLPACCTRRASRSRSSPPVPVRRARPNSPCGWMRPATGRQRRPPSARTDGRPMLSTLFPRVRGDQLWQATLDTLYMTAAAGAATFLLGLVLGAVLFLTSPGQPLANRAIYRIMSALVNVGRAIPFIILLVLLIPFTRLVVGTMLGVNAALPSLILGTAPFYARLVEIAFREGDRGVIEATR